MALHIRYFLSESLRSFRKAKWMSLATVSALGISLTLFSCFLIFFWYIHIQIVRGEEKMNMVAFLEEDYSSLDSAVVLRRGIEALAGVKMAGWVSKDSAIQIFRRRHGSEMLEAVDENPLPASFHISILPDYRRSDSMAVLQQRLYGIAGIEDVGYGKEWFPKLERIRNIFVLTALVTGGIMLLILFWITSNTIRFSLYARREIIEIMGYIGATKTFIRIPFYLENIIEGILGSVVAIIFLNFFIKILLPRFPELQLISNNFILFSCILFFTGVLGTSWIGRKSLKKHLS